MNETPINFPCARWDKPMRHLSRTRSPNRTSFLPACIANPCIAGSQKSIVNAMTPAGRSSTRRVGQYHGSMRHGGMKNFQDKVGFIWSVADLLRGDYRQSDYGKVILPLTVLRRLDCVLEPTKEKLLE